jgi:hypothetical protein
MALPLTTIPDAALASVLPDASLEVFGLETNSPGFGNGFTTSLLPFSQSASDSGQGGLPASASSFVSVRNASGSPDPTLSAAASTVGDYRATQFNGANGGDIIGAGPSTLELSYAFEVDGPVANVSVPIIVSANVEVIAGRVGPSIGFPNVNFAAANISVSGENTVGGDFICTVESGGQVIDAGGTPTGQSCGQVFNIQLALTVLTGQVDSVGLGVSVGVASGAADPSDASSSATAFIDPSIFVDPSVPDAGDYTITLSDGIGDPPMLPSTVPEPTSLAVLASAFAGLLVTRRRKRKAA